MAETTAMMVEPDPSREVPACEALVCHTYIPGHARAFCARSGEQRAAAAGIYGVEHAELGEEGRQGSVEDGGCSQGR